MCVLERSLWLRVEENGVEAGRQGRGCGQSREKMTMARPESWQRRWGDLTTRGQAAHWVRDRERKEARTPILV